MPVQRTAEPAVSEFSERRARLDSILVGFGFDPALIDQKLIELRTPLGSGGYLGGISTINADSTANEKAYAIASWLVNSKYSGVIDSGMDFHGNDTGLRGLDALCMDDRTLYGAIDELFRGSYYLEGAPIQMNYKAENRLETEAEKYGLNFTKLHDAALFQLWASGHGVAQEFIDTVGAQIFGVEWGYGRVAGSMFSPPDRAHDDYYFKTDDAIALMKEYASISEAPAPSTFAEEAQPEHERTQLDEFLSRYGRGAVSISDTLDRVLMEGRGWAGNYSQLFGNYDLAQVEEGAVFYAWAKKNGMGEDEINTLGSAHYRDNWALAALLGNRLSHSREDTREYVLKTDDAKAFQADLDSFRLSQPVVRIAETVAPAETTGLAAIAQSVGVTEDYLKEAVQLMVDRGAERVKIAYDRSDVGEEGTKPVTRDRNGYYVILFHRPEGSETTYSDSQLTDAVNKAADIIHPGSRRT